jgi:multidrug efflux system membrane fusion protein
MFEGQTDRARQTWNGWSVRTRWIAAGAALLTVVAIGWGLSGLFAKSDRQRPPPAVVVTRASVKTMTVTEHAVGTVVANATVAVTAQVSGPLLRAAFQEGQIVKKGELLFVIDPRPYQAALDAATAQRAKDEAQRLNAVTTQKRYDALFAQNAISPLQKDTAEAAAKSAIAAVAADDAAVATARLNLGYTEIKSPVNGKTGAILIQPGNLIAAGGANPLVVVTEIEPVKVSFTVPQTDLPQLQAREKSGALFADVHAGGTRLHAKVDFIGNQVVTTTGTVELRATFANTDHRLVPGEMVDVDVELNALTKAVVVPREAVNEGPNGRYVFVVGADSVARMRPVNVQFDDGTLMAVKGLKPGEQVIVDGQLRVLPGVRVMAAGKSAKSAGRSAKTP